MAGCTLALLHLSKSCAAVCACAIQFALTTFNAVQRKNGLGAWLCFKLNFFLIQKNFFFLIFFESKLSIYNYFGIYLFWTFCVCCVFFFLFLIFHWFLLYLILLLPLAFQNHSFEVSNSQINTSIYIDIELYRTFDYCIYNIYLYYIHGALLFCFCARWLRLYLLSDRLISVLKQLVWLLLTDLFNFLVNFLNVFLQIFYLILLL